MTAKQNGAQSAETNPMFSMAAMMAAPAANSVAVSQKLALETARFWARRMRAYADQMEMLAGCSNPNQLVAAQAQFIARMQEDFAAESAAMQDILTTAASDEKQS